MENVNVQYLNLLKDILDNGTYKKTRSGNVYSVFDRNIKIDMKQGFPLINTKKLFIRGSIHEMLWMLSGDTNIRYLVENNVHIWDDDAYRFYKTLIVADTKLKTLNNPTTDKDFNCNLLYDKCTFIENVKKQKKISYISKITIKTKNGDIKTYSIIDINNFDIDEILHEMDVMISYESHIYVFGDLGPVYGKQWRDYGSNHIDQIKYLIDLLKNNPDDRRLLCNAWNPSDMVYMALPPCHYAFQLYTRELTFDERVDLLTQKNPSLTTFNMEMLDNIPKRELSLKWYQRSCDFFLGVPLNISGYALILSLLAHCTNMAVGTLSGSFGDCHIYEQHLNAVREQLNNDPLKYKLPILKLNTEKDNIFDFNINDIVIENYESYPKISAPLCVG